MGIYERSKSGLSSRQIQNCIMEWEFLCDAVGMTVDLITDRAGENFSQTVYRESTHSVYLGANIFPGPGMSAGDRLSVMACLAHELAHADRHRRGFQRPLTLPDLHLDEAETSIHASFFAGLSQRDREDLIEHARDHLTD